MDLLNGSAKTKEQKKINDIVRAYNTLKTKTDKVANDDGSVFATNLGNDTNCGQLICKEVLISAADIVATGAGKLGHAAGYPLVANPGADYMVDLISAILIYDYATAAYTDGGNITVNENGGAALTGLVSAANSLGAAADKVVSFAPLATAGVARTANKGLNLVAASAFTQPGTAAGVVRVHVEYRIHKLGLA